MLPLGSVGAIYDRTQPADAHPTGPHARVWYATRRDGAEGATFADIHVIAKAECQRLNDGGELLPDELAAERRAASQAIDDQQQTEGG